MTPLRMGFGLWLGAVALAGAAPAQTAPAQTAPAQTAPALPVQAQAEICAARDRVVDRLASEYGETRQAIGLASADQVVEIFASEETGSWTITVTRTDGMTCLVAAGQQYQTLDEALTPSALGDPA